MRPLEGRLAKYYEFPRARRPGVRFRVVNYYVNCKVGSAYFLPQHESRCFPEPGGVRVARRPPEPATSPWGNVEFAGKHNAKTQLLAKVALNLQLPHRDTSTSHKKHHAKMKFLAEALLCAAKHRDPGGGRPRSVKSGVRAAASPRRTHTAAQSQSLFPTCPPPPLYRNPPISARP